MRLFIAIPLPENVIEIVKKFHSVLDKDFRPVRIEQAHMTVAFLGEMPEYGPIIRKLDKIRFKKFKIKTSGHGFFPSENKIRVLWIGLEENEEFIKLQHDIRTNFHFKEKLMPHITIARAKELIIDEEHKIKNFLNIQYDEAEFVVDKFYLMESVPGPNGYEHKILKVFEGE
jgi:2'-5' RNA ligase